MSFEQLSNRELPMLANVDQRSGLVDKDRHSVRNHLFGQQWMRAVESLLQILDSAAQCLWRDLMVPPKRAQDVQFRDVPERQHVSFVVRDSDQGLPAVGSEPKRPVLDGTKWKPKVPRCFPRCIRRHTARIASAVQFPTSARSRRHLSPSYPVKIQTATAASRQFFTRFYRLRMTM